MVDRTAAQLQVLDCPVEEVAAVLEIIQAHGLHLDLEEYDEDHTTDNQLALGVTYMPRDRLRHGDHRRQAAQGARPRCLLGDLRGAGPRLAGGSLPLHPDAGLWFAPCDVEDTPLFTEEMSTRPRTQRRWGRARQDESG